MTIYVDKREIVTLMIMGTHPEMLTPGYSSRHCPLSEVMGQSFTVGRYRPARLSKPVWSSTEK
jgi:hypothetical protein